MLFPPLHLTLPEQKNKIVFTLIKSHTIDFCPKQIRIETCRLQGSLLLATVQSFWKAWWALLHFPAVCDLDQHQTSQHGGS